MVAPWHNCFFKLFEFRIINFIMFASNERSDDTKWSSSKQMCYVKGLIALILNWFQEKVYFLNDLETNISWIQISKWINLPKVRNYWGELDWACFDGQIFFVLSRNHLIECQWKKKSLETIIVESVNIFSLAVKRNLRDANLTVSLKLFDNLILCYLEKLSYVPMA